MAQMRTRPRSCRAWPSRSEAKSGRGAPKWLPRLALPDIMVLPTTKGHTMATTFKPRPEAELVPADLNDRRRLAQTELTMIAEEGSCSPLALGVIILKHVRSEAEVIPLADTIEAKIRGRRR